MRLEILSREQVEKIYSQRLVIDFPKDELKPLDIILNAMDKGKYIPLGLFDESGIIGYAFIIKRGTAYMLDYLAVYPEHRCSGVGSKMIELIIDYLEDAKGIFAEVEDPDYAQDAGSKDIQIRRMNFYFRNGCIDTGLKVKAFGVPFRIIKFGGGFVEDLDDLWELYRIFYRCVFSDEIVMKNIKHAPNEWEIIAEPVVKAIVNHIADKDLESLADIVDNSIEDLKALKDGLDSFLEINEMEAFDAYGVECQYIPRNFDYEQQTCIPCSDGNSFSVDYDLTVNGELSDMTLQLDFRKQEDGSYKAHIIDVHVL